MPAAGRTGDPRPGTPGPPPGPDGQTAGMGDGVWLVIGVQAAGKSTVAEGLARAHDPAVHVRGYQFVKWATSGWVEPGDPDRPDEARRLLDLRCRLSARAAEEYGAAGFTTVVQDNLYGPDVVAWLRSVAARPRRLVVLRPSVAVVQQRDAARQRATGKVAYRPGGLTAADLDEHLDRTPRLGLWLDTSGQAPDETVAEILARADEAVVDAAL